MGCTIELNSNLTTDPRYTLMNSSVFETTEYTVQRDSGVLYLLESEPSYFTFVQNPNLKKNIVLNAWTRPT